jgi:hypothetical protein
MYIMCMYVYIVCICYKVNSDFDILPMPGFLGFGFPVTKVTLACVTCYVLGS